MWWKLWPYSYRWIIYRTLTHLCGKKGKKCPLQKSNHLLMTMTQSEPINNAATLNEPGSWTKPSDSLIEQTTRHMVAKQAEANAAAREVKKAKEFLKVAIGAGHCDQYATRNSGEYVIKGYQLTCSRSATGRYIYSPAVQEAIDADVANGRAEPQFCNKLNVKALKS